MGIRWVLGLLVLMSAPARAADSQWIVAIDGRQDVIVRAAGLTDGVPLVEAAALADALSLTLVTGPGEVVVHDGSGRTWYAVDGAPAVVDATDTRRFVPCRVQVLNDALYLPLTALAELAGYASVLDPAGRAFLFPTRAHSPVDDRSGPAPPGWTPLVVEKTPAELEETRRLEGLALERQDTRRTATPVLPPAHDVLRLVAGIGLVTGEDWATEIDAGGTVAGLRVNGGMFTTLGPLGLTHRHMTLLLGPTAETWAFQSGDLLGDLQGLTRGVRLAWGLRSRWQQRVGVERSRRARASTAPVVSYGSTWSPTDTLMAGGDISSDGALLLRSRYGTRLGSIDGFWRQGGPRDGRQFGGLLSVTVRDRILAGGGLHVAAEEGERSYLASITIPMRRVGTFSLQQVHTVHRHVTHAATGLSASVPIGPLQVFERFQWTDMVSRDHPLGLRAAGQQLHSVATYRPTPRLHLVYQSGTRWHPDGAATGWDEIQTSVQVSRTTWLHSTHAFPRLGDPDHLRVRLVRAVGDSSSVSIEYGQLPPFQPAHGLLADRPRLLVMVRHRMGLRTPADGSVVSGRVLDETGRAVTGSAVRLGPYLTLVDEDGGFRFEKVPAGDYTVELDAASLPAHYAPGRGRQRVALGPRTSVHVDLDAISLHSVHGRVYLDRNRNQRFDGGEGVAGVVVRLGDLATMTDGEGRYTFGNLAPGAYRVRLDRSRLRQDLEPASDDEADVLLMPDGAPAPVDFRLRLRDKPVLMQVVL